MPTSSTVYQREYQGARDSVRGAVLTALATVPRPMIGAIAHVTEAIVRRMIETRQIRKIDQERLRGYAQACVDLIRDEHTERRCWHATTQTWRPVSEGQQFKMGRLPWEAGEYVPSITVTFWKPQPGDTELVPFQGVIPDGYGTRYSRWEGVACGT